MRNPNKTISYEENYHCKPDSKLHKSPMGRNLSQSPCSPDYAYSTIEEFEDIVGYKVNDAFKDGWRMARITNKMLGIPVNK